MSHPSIDSLVTLLVLLVLFATFVGRLTGLTKRLSRLAGGLFLLALVLPLLALLAAMLRTAAFHAATVAEEGRAQQPLLFGALGLLVVLGHVALFTFLLRRRFARDTRETKRREGDAAGRRSRSILPDHLEGP